MKVWRIARVREPQAWRPVRRIGTGWLGCGEEGVEDASEGAGGEVEVASTQEEMLEMSEVGEEMCVVRWMREPVLD